MQIKFGNPIIPKDTFSPFPVRLVYLIAGIFVVIAPAWLTPSMYSHPFTFGEFEMLVFVAAGALIYKACITHSETFYSRADEDGITVVYSAIPGLLSKRQRFEELIPWRTVKEIVVLENEDIYWLNAVLVGSWRIVQLVRPGFIEGVEAKRVQEALNRMRFGKAT